MIDPRSQKNQLNPVISKEKSHSHKFLTEPPSTPVADPFTIAVWFPFWDEQQALHSLNQNADALQKSIFSGMMRKKMEASPFAPQ